MRVIRTITYPEGSHQPQLRDPDFPIHYLDHGGEVRSGFEKGTLQKAVFELKNGHIITYETKDEPE
jgi:hypothetical protein